MNLYLAFVFATCALMLIPGPNVAFILANSIEYGTRYGLLTVAGTSSAMVVQLIFVVAGMTAAFEGAGHWFEWIRWIGVFYLVYLGVRRWFERSIDLSGAALRPRSAKSIYVRGILVSLTNPKTLLFYGAFFPQFVTRTGSQGLQLGLLAGTFLALAILIDGSWAMLGGRFRHILSRRAIWCNRISGSLLVTAGFGLALVRKK